MAIISNLQKEVSTMDQNRHSQQTFREEQQDHFKDFQDENYDLSDFLR